MTQEEELKSFVDWFSKIGAPEYDGDRRKRFSPNRLSDNHMVVWVEKTSGNQYTTEQVIKIYKNDTNERRNTKAD